MRTFFICVPLVQKLKAFFFVCIGHERNPHVIFLIFLFYCIFYGMLKRNPNAAGYREPLEPSDPVACLEQDFCQHQCLWIRSAGLNTARWENFHGWRVYICALTLSSVAVPCKCCDSSNCPVWMSHARLLPVVTFMSLWMRPWLHHLCSFSSSSWKQSSDCPLATFSQEWEVWAPWSSPCR